MEARVKTRQEMQSVEAGMRLVKALAAASDPLMLKNLSAAARIPQIFPMIVKVTM